MALTKEKRGEYSINGIPILGGVFDIPKRLREIDPGYFIIINRRTRRYEIHHEEQPHTTFCLEIPYDELDDRTLSLVRETMISKVGDILSVIDENNSRIEKTADTEIMDTAKQKTIEILKYLKNSNSEEKIPANAYTTRFV